MFWDFLVVFGGALGRGVFFRVFFFTYRVIFRAEFNPKTLTIVTKIVEEGATVAARRAS